MLEKMSDFFEARLDGYDEHMMTAIESADEFYPFTARQLPNEPNARVLDLGCGTGLELEEYFKLNPTAKITGVDLSEGMLNALREKFKHKDITLIKGSYFDVPFGVSVFDCAVSVESLHHFTKEEKILAIGEIGLDYHYEDVPREIQKECFDSQMSIAGELGLPVIIHDREAHKDSLDIAKAHKGISGVFHCFSGSSEMAREVLDLGLYIAFGGSLTFKNNVKTVEAAKYVPLDRIVVETDCPYLTPVPYRGKRNSSLYLGYVIEKIAELKGISPKEVEMATYENACRLFNIER